MTSAHISMYPKNDPARVFNKMTRIGDAYYASTTAFNDNSSAKIYRVDPSTGRISFLTGKASTAGFPAAGTAEQTMFVGNVSLFTDGTTLYAADAVGIRRIDQQTGATTYVYTNTDFTGGAVFINGYFYGAIKTTGRIYKVDPATQTAQQIIQTSPISQLVTDGTAIYANVSNGTGANSRAEIQRIPVDGSGYTSFFYQAQPFNQSGTTSLHDLVYVNGRIMTWFRSPSTGYVLRSFKVADKSYSDIPLDTPFAYTHPVSGTPVEYGFGPGPFIPYGGGLLLGGLDRMAQASQVAAPPLPTTSTTGPVATRETLGGCNLAQLSAQAQRCHADPINTATGAFTLPSTDMSVGGRGPGLTIARTYDSSNAANAGAFGLGWSESFGTKLVPNSYSASGSMLPTAQYVDVVSENGSQLTFTRQTDGSYAAPSRVLATLTQESDGTWTFVRNKRNTFTFDSSGRITSTRDLNGETVQFGYDAGGQLTSLTDGASRTLALTWAGGRVSQVSGPLGRKVTYQYDSVGHLLSVTMPDGGVTKYTYAPGTHRMTSWVSPQGSVTATSYDASGRASQQVDPTGGTTAFAYDGSGPTGTWTVTITDPRGTKTVQTYTDSLLTKEVIGAGTPAAATSSYEYDPVSLGITKVTDPLGRVTTTTRSSTGQPLTITDPLGRVAKFTYDAIGNVLTATDTAGVVTTNTYDARGNLLTTSTPPADGATPVVVKQAYADTTHPGDMTSSTNANGKVSTYTYDTAGNLLTVTDPLGNTSSATYDAAGQKLTATTARGNASGASAATTAAHTTTTAYDAAGRVTSVTDPLGRKTTLGYDADSNPTTITDPKNQTTTTTYDAVGRATQTTRADGTTTKAAYDAGGLLTSTTNAAGKVTTYTYDALGRPTKSTDPLGRSTSATYDLAGQRTTTTDALGKTTTYTYDSAGQQTKTAYNDPATTGTSAKPGTPDVTYTYDSAGRAKTMVDGTGTTTWAYDQLDRLTAITNGAGAKVSYAYDAAGQQTGLTYPGTTGSVSRTFDAAGRMTALTDPLGKTFTFAYDAEGHLTSTTYPNKVNSDYAWDQAGQLTASSVINNAGTSPATLASFTNTLDANGLVSATTTTGTPQVDRTYAYDKLGQLTGSATTGTSAVTTAMTYDAADNITKTDAGAALAYDVANQLTSATPATGAATTFAFDANGQRTSATTGTGASATSSGYSWDQAGRLVKITVAGAADTAYTYDGGGLRQSATSSSAAAATVLAQDSFARTVTSGLGSADTGGAWTSSNASKSSVNNGAAAFSMTTGQTITGYLGSVSSTDTDVTVTVATDKAATGGGNYFYLLGRRVSATSDYRTTARVLANQSVQLSLNRTSSSPASAALGSTTVSGLSVGAGQKMNLRLQVSGTNPTTIKAKAWAAGSSEPTAWQLSTTDSTSELQKAGSVGMASYLSGSATNAPVVASFSAFKAATTATTAANVSTAFTWDTSQGLPLLLSDGLAYVYGPGGIPLEQISAGTPTYLSGDTLGSVRVLTNASAAVVGTSGYSPYGTPTRTGSVSSRLGFAGEYTDPTGLVYLRARYYDPATSQFLSRDPLEAVTGQPYSYAANSPLNRTDPSGAIDVGAALERALTTGRGKSVTEFIVGFGNGASFGLAGMIAEGLSSGSMCTINTSSGWYSGGSLTGVVATTVASGGTSTSVSVAVATPKLATGASNAANGARLASALRLESAGSMFTRSGQLTQQAVAESRLIIPGSRLGNKELISELTKDGSKIGDWGKYTTRTHQSPSGDFQVHYYMNSRTGQVNYNYDYKSVFNRR